MIKSITGWLGAVVLVVSCQTGEPGLNEYLLPEELATLHAEVTEDLGLTTEQADVLKQSLHHEADHFEAPGFLWVVARHLQEHLPGASKEQLLQQVVQLEEGLQVNGVCIPLGFEVNFSQPLHPHPAMVMLVLVPEQEEAFGELLQLHQNVAAHMITLRHAGSLSPEEFYAGMQQNFNSLMTHLIVNLLHDDQRLQLGDMLGVLAGQRQQFIQQSFGLMAAALEPGEAELHKTITLSIEIETRKAFLEQKLHAGEITPEEAHHIIQVTCSDFHHSLAELFTDKQLEIVRIYRALSFRPRMLMVCDTKNP